MKEKLIEDGMNVVGKNLGLIRSGNFESLTQRINDLVFLKFEKDETTLKRILEMAADRLFQSRIFWWRKKDARDIYNYLGLEKKAREADEEYIEICIRQSFYQQDSSYPFV